MDTAAAATPQRATGEAAAIGRAARGGRVSGCRRRGEERTRWPLEPEIAAGVIAGGARVIEIGVPRRRGAAKRMGGQVCDGWGGSVDQGSTFRRKTAGKPENFPFPLVAGKWNSGIFRHFSFSNLKIQKYL